MSLFFCSCSTWPLNKRSYDACLSSSIGMGGNRSLLWANVITFCRAEEEVDEDCGADWGWGVAGSSWLLEPAFVLQKGLIQGSTGRGLSERGTGLDGQIRKCRCNFFCHIT